MRERVSIILQSETLSRMRRTHMIAENQHSKAEIDESELERRRRQVSITRTESSRMLDSRRLAKD